METDQAELLRQLFRRNSIPDSRDEDQCLRKATGGREARVYLD
jgi:hypothetical protein